MKQDRDASKKSAGEKAAGYVTDGMILGLGTGSTVRYFMEKLAEKIKEDSLNVAGVPTSAATEKLAKALNIPLTSLSECEGIDLDVDGADEVDAGFNLLKGGGGAHTREKIVAGASRRFIVIVDAEKVVGRIGAFPVAIEALPFAEAPVMKGVIELGGLPRKREGFLTDNGNIVLDARFNIIDAEALEEDLKSIPGVVESGIFAKRRPEKVIVGDGNKTKEMERE